MRYWEHIIHFSVGAAALLIFSVLNKAFMLADMEITLNLLGYIAPFLYGGVTGMIVGVYLHQIKDLNAELKQRVESLEEFVTMCSVCNNICTNPEKGEDERESG